MMGRYLLPQPGIAVCVFPGITMVDVVARLLRQDVFRIHPFRVLACHLTQGRSVGM